MATYRKFACCDIVYTTSITSSTITNLPFRISVSNNIVYEGKAYKIPGTSTIEINITKICRDYLDFNFPDFNSLSTGVFNHPDAYKAFVLSTYNVQTDSWNNVNTYYFLFYWAGDMQGSSITGNLTLSEPITGVKASNMLLPYTTFSYSNGTVSTSFSTSSGLYPYTGCGQYAIYYLSEKGGIDAFLFEGECIKNDDYDIYSYGKKYNNLTTEFGTTRYLNEIKHQYQLNTGYMNDSQSKRFAEEIVGSNMVVLHDLFEGTFEPVNIVDVQVKYKTYKNEDNTPSQYTLTVESSQTKYRR